MKLEEIYEHWGKDSDVDQNELDYASLNIAKLHVKYYRFLSQERLLLIKLEHRMKRLKKDKYEFYTDGPTKEQHEKGWKLPPKGKILKNEVQQYLEADPDIIELNLKIAYQQEKLHLLESIIRTLHNRGFHIKNAIDFEKFKTGSI